MNALHPLLEYIASDPTRAEIAPLRALVRHLRPRRNESTVHAQERLLSMVDTLKARPHLADGLYQYISNVLMQRRQRFLFAESGILQNTGFFTELWRRVGGHILPPALDHQFLRDLIDELFDRSGDGEWLASIPAQSWRDLLLAIGFFRASPTPGLMHTRQELIDALRILACRLAALGLEPDLVRYYAPLAQYESPFLAQQRELETLLEPMLRAQAEAPATWPDCAHLEVLLAQCEDALARIRRQSHESGAAVGLTWHLNRATQMIERMQLLLQLVQPNGSEERRDAAFAFVQEVVRAECRRNSLRDLMTNVTDLLAMQVTEHASKTGEHYLTQNRSEFFAMFRAAAGAGVIVGFMSLIKTFITAMHLPPLWETVGYSLNYGLGFVLIHLLGFTIATKQPAMTAATLAAALDPRRTGASPLDEMTELIVQVSRSQWIAIAGNVLLGVLTSMAIALAWQALAGAPLISTEKAQHMLHDLHPWWSLALPHAAIAGVCLFLAGLVSGYYDNKAIYNRVPERLRRVRWLRKLLGDARSARLADYIEHNLGALAGNFLFGCMLGSMGFIGFILGLPLDIRHVTFAAANIAYGMQGLAFAVPWQEVLILSAGVLLIGMVNLVVSFALAMRVALKSRRVRFSESRKLIGMLLRRFFRKPRDFFWPPGEKQSLAANKDAAADG